MATELPPSTVDTSMITEDVRHEMVDTSMTTESPGVTDTSVLTDVHVGCGDAMCELTLEAAGGGGAQHSAVFNKQTMTDRTSTVDTGSAMTPLKLNKKGHRMTAEDVRRQHPRAVANQLETTQAANQRLDRELAAVTRERDQLLNSLKEFKSKLSVSDKLVAEMKTTHSKDISLLEQLHTEAVEGLQSCVQDKQRRVEEVEAELAEVKEGLRVREARLCGRIQELEAGLGEAERCRGDLEQRHASELERVQSEFAKNSYKREFESSMRVIANLQCERDEMEGLMGDIEGAADLQFRLRDSLHQLANRTLQSVKENKHKHRQLVTEYNSLRQKLASLQVDYDIAQTENCDLQEDVRNVNEILQRSSNSLLELEKMYDEATQDLSDSQGRVKRLSEELTESTEAIEVLLQARDSLTQQLADSQDSESLLHQALQESQEQLVQMEEALQEKEEALLEKEGTFSAYVQDKDVVIADQQDVISKLELYTENLQHTLDSWEQDRDLHRSEMERLSEEVEMLQADAQDKDAEVKRLREVREVAEQEKDDLQDLRNTNHFLEAEKQLYLEAITDYRTKLECETQQLAKTRAQLAATETSLGDLHARHAALQVDKAGVEAELTARNADIEETLPVLDSLEQSMDSVLSVMQKKFNIDVKLELMKDRVRSSSSSSSSVKSQGGRHSSSRQQTSFVASVLARSAQKNRAGSSSSSSTPQVKQSNVELGDLLGGHDDGGVIPCGRDRDSAAAGGMMSRQSQSFCVTADMPKSTPAKKCLSFCESSEQRQHRLLSSSTKSFSDLHHHSRRPQDGVAGFAKIRSIPPTMNHSLEVSERLEAGNLSILSDSMRSADPEPMLPKVKSMERIFSMVVRAMHMANRASELTVRDLREDLELSQNKVKFLQSQEKKKSEQLMEADSQIKDLNLRVGGLTNSVVEFQEQSSRISQLEDDTVTLRCALGRVEGEKALLGDQLEQVIAKMDAMKTGHQPEGACIREIVALKKKNYESQCTLLDERQRNRDLGLKAMKRMQILESNWQKAENDVARFDELVENIRQLCIKHESRQTHPAVLDIIRAIDGLQSRSQSPVGDDLSGKRKKSPF